MQTKQAQRTVLALGPVTEAEAWGVPEADGFEVIQAHSVGALLQGLREEARRATLLSLGAADVGEELIRRVGEHPNAGVLLLTCPAVTMERALLAQRVGAFALLREPLDACEVRAQLDAAADEGAAVRIPEGESTDPDESGAGSPRLVGDSPAMAAVFQSVARVASSDATVLLTGESGTGKEVVARTLHAAGARRTGPFVAVNCAAIPEHLLESELFGHERGAFTGAVARRNGRFQRAQGGTLFLDEIGDMALVLQAKLLRALEDGVVERVGSEASERVDVRIVAATNQNLHDAISRGRFREDLYYRLAVVELNLPPLRQRGDDVRRLALHFAAEFARKHGAGVTAITERALRRLEAYAWPGNVRELRNVVNRAVLVARGSIIGSTDLRLGAAAPSGSGHEASNRVGYAPELSLQEVEADHIRNALQAFDGHMAQAAESLGIHRNTLTRKLKEYGIGAEEGGARP